jgi:hypothetical protein
VKDLRRTDLPSKESTYACLNSTSEDSYYVWEFETGCTDKEEENEEK